MQDGEAHGPRDHIGEFEGERGAVRASQRPGHLAHLLDEPPERSVGAPRAVARAERGRDLSLQGTEAHGRITCETASE